MRSVEKTIVCLLLVLAVLIPACMQKETTLSLGNDPHGAGSVTTPSGLVYQDVIVGSGATPVAGKQVKVHYTGRLDDGTVFDSSIDRGTPLDFVIGVRQVIRGWDEGVMGMKVGGKRRLIIPPELAYGAAGAGEGQIPPNATLIFDVELLAVAQ